jgi:hypothetical protein
MENRTAANAGWDKRATRVPAHHVCTLPSVGRRGLAAAGPTLPLCKPQIQGGKSLKALPATPFLKHPDLRWDRKRALFECDPCYFTGESISVEARR